MRLVTQETLEWIAHLKNLGAKFPGVVFAPIMTMQDIAKELDGCKWVLECDQNAWNYFLKSLQRGSDGRAIHNEENLELCRFILRRLNFTEQELRMTFDPFKGTYPAVIFVCKVQFDGECSDVAILDDGKHMTIVRANAMNLSVLPFPYRRYNEPETNWHRFWNEIAGKRYDIPESTRNEVVVDLLALAARHKLTVTEMYNE
jgi:hypothetical protein